MKRLHIVGCPRSGTTLMMELMVTCFRNDGFCEHEMSLFTEPDQAVPLFFSKQPSDIRYIEEIFLKDPDLFVIYMVRDPRSVITSIHRSRPDEYFCNYRVWKECNDPAGRLEGHERFLSLRYEDLARDPDLVQARVAERFPFLQKLHDFSGYEKHARPSGDSLKAMSGLRPVSASRIAGWQEHLPRVKAELLKHPEMSAELIACGYEKDDAWVSLLDEVEAVNHPCRYPDTVPYLKRLDVRLRKWLASRRYLRRHGLK